MGCDFFFSHSNGHDFAGLVGIQRRGVMQGESFRLVGPIRLRGSMILNRWNSDLFLVP